MAYANTNFINNNCPFGYWGTNFSSSFIYLPDNLMLDFLKKIVKNINNITVLIVLFLFYFLPFGLISLIIKTLFGLRNLFKERVTSYWKESKAVVFTEDYFESPY